MRQTLSRTMVAKALCEAGHDVVEAADGKKGIAAFQSQPFDCVVTDLLMPVVDGHGLLTYIRRVDRKIPVVVLTADIQTSTQAMCEEFSISGFVNKPVKADVLRACVEEALLHSEGASPCI